VRSSVHCSVSCERPTYQEQQAKCGWGMRLKDFVLAAPTCVAAQHWVCAQLFVHAGVCLARADGEPRVCMQGALAPSCGPCSVS
jgi:hypothetical protein